jgi:membrane associated rhomboid family serine protease
MTTWIKRLIVANVLVYLVTSNYEIVGNALALDRHSLFAAPWTLVTYMFVHANFQHILWNMVGLFFLGPRVEIRLGGPRFLGLYFTGGIVGGIMSVLINGVAPDGRLIGIVGASAAIFAVYLAYAMFWPRERLLIWGIIPIPAMVLVGILTLISLAGGTGLGHFEPGVAHWGHLGGFVGGYVYLTILKHQTGSQKFRAKAAPLAPVPKSPETVARWRSIDPTGLHPVNREELTRIMAKLDRGGPASLTTEERSFLERFANN